jgi:signal peptidase I
MDGMLRLRRTLEWTVLAVILALAVRTFYGQWQVVVSASMADTLVGPHYDVTCADCGHTFQCDADPPLLGRAVCPNCGFANERLGDVVDGNQLWVDRAAFYWNSPERWDVVVFHSPDAAGEPTVKRIVGLPGETIEIRAGEVFAEGQIIRKPLDVARALAVLVHDTAFQPGQVAPVPTRWVATNGSAWRADAGRFVLPRGESPDGAWLEYRHWQRLPTRPNQVEEVPIRDDDAYNAGRSRRLNDVPDLLLFCRVKVTGAGHLTFRVSDGRHQSDVTIEPATGRISLSRAGEPALETVALSAPLLARETNVEIALVDGQVICALDGVVHLNHAYQADGVPRQATARPVAIGAHDLSVEIARLQLFRDVYYTDAPAPRARQAHAVKLGADEYFVLGDNSPVSNDSRTWADSPALPARCLIGKPLGVR